MSLSKELTEVETEAKETNLLHSVPFSTKLSLVEFVALVDPLAVNVHRLREICMMLNEIMLTSDLGVVLSAADSTLQVCFLLSLLTKRDVR